MRDRCGRVVGLAGISRDLRVPGDREGIPPGLVSTLEFLERNCDEHLSPGSLAKMAKLPFARLIKRIFRLTPNQLITQTRLNAAARLLVKTDGSIAEIAVCCGFYDHSALTRGFSFRHLTPSSFRALKRQ
jgi:transcriptional regulator GlxA family with amidase domain